MIDKEQQVKDILIKSIRKTSLPSLVDEHSYKTKKSQVISAKKEKAKVAKFDGPKRKNHIKDDLAEWNNRDFSIYILSKYNKKYKDNWLPSIANIAVQLDRIKESIHDILGFCDNIVFKDYIDNFFSNWSDYYRRRANNVLYLSHLRGKESINEFVDKYNYQNSLKRHSTLSKSKKQKECVDIDLDNSYLLGDKNFVSDYGIILTCNWLIMRKKYDIRKAANYVARAFLKLFKKGMADLSIKSTVKYSPYPSWFVFKKYRVILQAVKRKTNKEINMDIEFIENDKFCFLKEYMVRDV